MKGMCMLLLCLLLTCTPAGAASEELLTKQSEALGLDGLSEAAGEYGPGESVAEVDWDQGLRGILEEGEAAKRKNRKAEACWPDTPPVVIIDDVR